MHDGPHAAQRIAKRRGIGEVAERYLDAHALGAQPPRVAHQTAHLLVFREQPAQERRADEAGGAGEQQHAFVQYAFSLRELR